MRAAVCFAACSLATVGVGLASRSEPAGAAFPGPNGRIAFTVGDDNGANEEIYSILPDGSGRDNLTATAGSDDQAAWSADGTKIAFRSGRDGNGEIYTMNADGSDQVNRTNNAATDSEPAWSPDGAKIAFVRSSHIWVMNADGSGQAELSDGTDDQPAWSPDGTKIAFSRSGGLAGIYVMDADGSDAVNVDGNSGGTSPSWSPGGTKIAFTHPSGNGDIYVTNADGSGSPTPVATDPDGDDAPAWSPDGTKIAFESSRAGFWEIFAINVDGTGLENITDNDALEIDDNRPDWGRMPAPGPGPAPAPGGGGGDVTSPVLSSLSLSRTVFRAARRGPSIAAVGTRVSYLLSESATTTFRVQRRTIGRRVGGRCVRRTARNRDRRRCVRYVTLRGRFNHSGAAGVNRFLFRGRLGGRTLRPGRHRLVALPRDAAGNRGAPRRARFRILR